MANLSEDGYIWLSSEEFKSFLRGDKKEEILFEGFYSEIKSINSNSIHANNLKLTNELVFDEYDIFTYDITLSNCIFEEQVKFDGGVFNQIWFTRCSFLEEVKINNGTFNKWLWYSGCTFNNAVRIYNGNFKSFHYSNNHSKKQLIINGGVFDDLHLNSFEEDIDVSIKGVFLLINHIFISGTNFRTINIKDCNINILKIDCIFSSNALVFIENIKLYYLFFNELTNLGNIFLSNIEVLKFLMKHKELSIEEMYDNSFVYEDYEREDIDRAIKRYNIKNVTQYVNNFYKSSSKFLKRNEKLIFKKLFYCEGKDYENIFIKVQKPSLKILDSVLGTFQIKNLEIKNFEDIILDSSDLSSVKMINSRFPTKKGRIKSLKNTNKNLYHLYNDLYSSSSKQNNVKEKIEYYKASQVNLLLSTKEETFSFNKLSSIWSLKVSKFYSDYGQNWFKALFVTIFLIGFLFYGLFLISLENIEFDFSVKGINFYYINLLEYYPQFLNPTHKISFINEIGVLGKLSSMIDLLSRIFIGIGFFEIIRSFRKYVRK
jgi:hypothetical protein